MKQKYISLLKPVCWLFAGNISWYLSLIIYSTITYKCVGPSVSLIKRISPFFVPATLFVMYHVTEYMVGAIIIAILSWLFRTELGYIILFVIGAIFKQVELNFVMILSYYKSSEAASIWTKTVLFQDIISSLVVFPAIVIATTLLINGKENAQHSARPVG